jgi:hypothetical protein
MKVAITLLVLGLAGLAQYIYFQFTPLAYNYDLYESGSMIHVTATRDWTIGLVGAILGAILLGVGIYRLRHRKTQSQSI